MDVVRNVKGQRPTKMFIYLPVYLKKVKPGRPPAEGFQPEYYRTVIKDNIPFSRIEVGDSFIIEKRDSMKSICGDNGEKKVVKVKRSFIDGSCLVILEDMIFDDEDKLKEFLKNKHSVK